MAIDPQNTDTVAITQLDPLTLALETFLVGANADGKMGNYTALQLAEFISPYVASLGAVPYVPTTGTTLSNPTSKPVALTFVGSGTYTQTTGGNVVTTEQLNVLSWNGTTWALSQAIPINTAIQNNVNGLKALFYSSGDSNITWDDSTKTLTTTANIYVYSGTYNAGNPYIVRISAASLNLTSAIAAFPTSEWFYIYAKPPIGFIGGTGGSTYAVALSALLVKSYNDPTIMDVRDNTAIVMFKYNKRSGIMSSDFFDDKLLNVTKDVGIPGSLRTKLNLTYYHKGEFSLNQATDVLTWDDNLYIFNNYKGASTANFLRIDAGSFDFKTYADASIYEFFSAYLKLTDTAGLSFVKGSGASGVIIPVSSIVYKSYNEAEINDLRENNGILLFTYNKVTRKIYSPFLEEDTQTSFLKGGSSSSNGSAWTNRFPNVYKNIQKFFNRYAGYDSSITLSAETPLDIIAYGDSLFARYNHTSVLNVDPQTYPPTLITKSIISYVWEQLKGNKPTLSRFDKAGRFTEVGTWADAIDLAIWDDAGDISTITRRRVSTNASISFVSGVNTTYFNFIDRMDSEATANAVVSIASGNGLLQARIQGDATWVEANGFSFSQRNPAVDAANGIGNTKYQRRVEFKKVGSGVGTSITVLISKGTANADSFLYWGIEEVTGTKPYIRLTNVARGGHTLATLKPYIVSDVIQRKPKLVILELPLLNMIPVNSTISYIVNQVHDFVWGDRSGNLNPLSLKNQSNNWVDFEVLLVIPHHSRAHFNSDSSFLIQSSGFTAEEIYAAVKGFISYRGDVSFIDISSAMLSEINSDPLYNGNYYAALTTSSQSGVTYLNDAVHQNDKGTVVWAKNLCPVFWLTTI